MADTSVNEILDGMDIRFGTSPRPLVNGDSIAVQSAKGDFFHFLVQRPEGDFGAVVSCDVPPLFWTRARGKTRARVFPGCRHGPRSMAAASSATRTM